MNCLECRGACCEHITLQIPQDPDAARWLSFHGTEALGGVVLDTPCKKLTKKGLCSIYDTRPQVCHDFMAGSKACYDAVRFRRTRAQYAKIRETGDPDEIHS